MPIVLQSTVIYKKKIYKAPIHSYFMLRFPPILAGWRNMCIAETETLKSFFGNDCKLMSYSTSEDYKAVSSFQRCATAPNQMNSFTSRCHSSMSVKFVGVRRSVAYVLNQSITVTRTFHLAQVL